MNPEERYHSVRRFRTILGVAAIILVFLALAWLPWQINPQQTAVLAARAITPGINQFFFPLLMRGVPLTTPQPAEYVLLGWNDLGMHCYNRDFQDLGVLPPFNTLWAQVIRKGDPPVIVTAGIRVEYAFEDNSYSNGVKSNFWTYAQPLFNLASPLPANVGLTGNGLSGEMEMVGDHFVAEGIPLTEFRDSAPAVPYPYQKAFLTAVQTGTGQTVAQLTVVAPVSTEMHCDTCHSETIAGVSTGSVETNILTLHDEENSGEYPPGWEAGLMGNRPVLCAECHRSNALAPYGVPGTAGIPSLSNAMHEKHAEEFPTPNTMDQCYNCHPGPQTQCLRDVMSEQEGMTCIDCHGDLQAVSENPTPWLNEPRCDSCHTAPEYAQDQALYRMSSGHGGLYCAACHDSPHAIAPSREANDAIKFYELQSAPGPVSTCTTCHLTQPTGTVHGN